MSSFKGNLYQSEYYMKYYNEKHLPHDLVHSLYSISFS